MSDLFKQIEKDFITAYKAKEEVVVSVLRMLKTAVKNKEVEVQAALTDEQVLAIVSTYVKRCRDSIEQFRAADRQDLAAQEEAELPVLMRYMPKQITGQELEDLVKETIAAARATGMQDMGRVMGIISKKYKGQMDGKALSETVRRYLATQG